MSVTSIKRNGGSYYIIGNKFKFSGDSTVETEFKFHKTKHFKLKISII